MAEAATVGNYVLERELGRGGMGAVYAGVHKLVGQRAAVKVLLPDLSRKPELVERFFNEAKAAGKISHPSIVRIYDFGYAADGSAYIVMELLEGETLAARLKRGPMTIPVAVALARQVANALGAAHSLGIVHRDLKPDNVFLIKDPEVVGGERVKLLDFGIAKLAADSAGVSATVTGAILGTPHYMSPEQCEGSRVVDARTDLYSLGCMLFQMVTGKLPFESQGIGGLIGMHLHVAPPLLRTRFPAASPELEAVIARLLAKPVEERFQSAEAVANALGAATVSAVMPTSAASTAAAIPSAMGTVPSGSRADATELGSAPTMHTPSSMPPGAGTRGAGTRGATEVDRQARAETVPVTAADIAAASLRPATVPADPAGRATGKVKPPRGDDPTVPSIPPQVIARDDAPERVSSPPAARGKRGPRLIMIVSVIVVAVGSVMVVTFATKNSSPDNGGIANRGGSGSGTAGLVGTNPGTGFGFTEPDAALAVVPVADAAADEVDDDLVDAARDIVAAMKEAAASREFSMVHQLYSTVVDETDRCGAPCAAVRTEADEIMARAHHGALNDAEAAIARKVKAGECDSAKRLLRAAIAEIGDDAKKLESLTRSCKSSGGGTGSGSSAGSGDGSGSGSGTGSAPPSADPIGDLYAAAKWVETVQLCKERNGGKGINKIKCAAAACNAGDDYDAVFRAWMRKLRRAQQTQVIRACAGRGAGGGTPDPVENEPTDQTNPPATNAPNTTTPAPNAAPPRVQKSKKPTGALPPPEAPAPPGK